MRSETRRKLEGDNTMKKILLSLISLMFIVSLTMVCYAGDIPESLLDTDSSQVYFGEIKSIDGDRITVIQRQNIKGEFSEDSEHTYEKFLAQTPAVGETYLCAFLNEHNPLYIWEVSSFELSNLKIVGAEEGSEMIQRMEKYLNDGTFTKKEQERLSKLKTSSTLETANNVVDTSSQQSEITNADITANSSNPTDGSQNAIIFVVAVLAVIAIIGSLVFWKRKKN